jgi:hypothetical protein
MKTNSKKKTNTKKKIGLKNRKLASKPNQKNKIGQRQKQKYSIPPRQETFLDEIHRLVTSDITKITKEDLEANIKVFHGVALVVDRWAFLKKPNMGAKSLWRLTQNLKKLGYPVYFST